MIDEPLRLELLQMREAESGEINPLPIEDADHVDERRRAVGLIPLAENTARTREGVTKEKEPRPHDWALRQKEFEDWARETGWRD